MKIPALRAKVGDWDFYVTTLTFAQVRDYVSKIDDQLHKSEGLRDAIQRNITENYLNIKEYILKQPERFFNAVVLAVYNEYPNWREIEFTYGDLETYQMGLLEFPKEHKIFPVDGQHRVEGIKAALVDHPELENETVAAIFIGHKNTDEGMERTRRLFTTLNRYAKPVTLNDLIALDEDDSVAIITRELLEEYDLFSEKRVVLAKQKAIPSNNKTAITSIITLYQANVELYKALYFETHGIKLAKPALAEKLKFQPSDEDYAVFRSYCLDFWDAFKTLSIIKEYLGPYPKFDPFRNNRTGGNLVFRPIGFLPLVKAAIKIKQASKYSYQEIFARFDELDFTLKGKPWTHVLWNPTEHTMVMNTSTLTEMLLLYLFDKKQLAQKAIAKLKREYASQIGVEDARGVAKVLNGL